MAAYSVAALLAVAALAAAGFLIWVSSVRNLSSLETTLLQLIILAAGLIGSYIFGRQSAKAAAQELMKPAARSAFRRVLGLYASLGRLAEMVRKLRNGNADYDRRLDVLEALATEHQFSANDAMEDWRDLVPEDVEEIERRIQEKETGQEVETLGTEN